MATMSHMLIHQHNLWLLLVAVLLCVAGSWVTTQLFFRTLNSSGAQRIGWQIMTALTAGVAICCTHFVAMLGYKAGVQVGFDPYLTFFSLFIAISGSVIGFVLAAQNFFAYAPVVGGAIVGLSVAAMHYTGMLAYRVQGVVTWDIGYLVVSIVLSVVFSALALYAGVKFQNARGKKMMAMLLTLSIAALHFTGMAAFQVTPLSIEGRFSNPEALAALAISISGMASVILISGVVSYVIDSSARAETVAKLRRLAHYDLLTGLPNRTSFNGRIEKEIVFASNHKTRFALIVIDLNRFKEINDSYGHKAGDQVLTVLGRRLQGILQENKGEYIARVGGDEFVAVYQMHDDSRGGIERFIQRLSYVLFQPIRLEHSEVRLGASFGVAIFPDDALIKEALINNADLAMYRAKEKLIDQVCFYEVGMDEIVKLRRKMASDLRNALSNNQFFIHYQLQVSISTQEIKGYEALLRWHHPENGLVSPEKFIPISEENGLILPIGEWVLRTACKAAATWDPPYKVAVNISPVQFVNHDLPTLISTILSETNLPPNQLELELTESAIFHDKERALHILAQIKALGVAIALDDFGTGYSSLDLLRMFPFDKIKLDRSFISGAVNNRESIAIIRSVLALGKVLDIPVLAEGVETREQFDFLHTEGCDEAQGYLLGHPLPLEKIVQAGQIRLLTH